MMHVKQIEEIIDAGATDQAHEALDQLLALGPHNTAALKLRAKLYEMAGRFAAEAKIWDRIASVDREDEDAISYLFRRQKEDREHFYFTDDVPGGGRRYTACPSSLITCSAIGLVGCLSFLGATRFADTAALLNDPKVMLAIFAGCVVVPWMAIIYIYLRCLRSVTITAAGITFATRLRTIHRRWDEVAQVCLASQLQGTTPRLWLVLSSADPTLPRIDLDLTLGRTAVRARAHLVRDLARYYREPESKIYDDVPAEGRKVRF